MSEFLSANKLRWIPVICGAIAGVMLLGWFARGSGKPLSLRVPGTDRAPGSELGGAANPVLAGKLVKGDGMPAALPGYWPTFRGTNFDNISREPIALAREWQGGEPRQVWGVDVGEGYAGPVVANGRVYLMDYDRDNKQDDLRCLSLADGREIWRFSYPVAVKRNHGMSRTVPAIGGNYIVAMGPKCHVVCLDATSGELRWGLDLVREYGTTVPPWYAGQCPLIDNGAVILAPAGRDALLLALDLQTGKPIWQTTNSHGWKMTHSSIAPAQIDGEKMYIYCADKGVVAVSARDGSLLWETSQWKISIATVPSPLVLDDGRVFLSGGYNAGSLMLQLKKGPQGFSAQQLFKLEPEIFGATQHTPIFYENHIYGVRPDNRFSCLTLEGKTVWVSDGSQQFGLGPFMLADGVILAMNDTGLLRIIEATPAKYTLLGQSQILKGHDSWGPMAIAGGRLLARDLTRLVCLELPQKRGQLAAPQ